MTTYVYDDTEVRLTGRTAIKRKQVTRRDTGTGSSDCLVEIVPVQKPPNGMWSKWVKKSILYTVDDSNSDEHTFGPVDFDDEYTTSQQEEHDPVLEEMLENRHKKT